MWSQASPIRITWDIVRNVNVYLQQFVSAKSPGDSVWGPQIRVRALELNRLVLNVGSVL